MSDFRRNSAEFTREYPVVLSTTYSIKGTLSVDHIYDYLIVDEASQVDLATGVLAFSCARNIVIVGDLKQLPNVLTEDDIRTSDAIWQKYSLDERYRFSPHSLLSSALEIWQDAPVTLLREHYRCHPKIINFCNQKFYHGQLIVMTKDHDEPDVLTMYRTTAGNHARGHLNQRQIDVIQQEVLPRLHQQNFESIGIITPYRDQVTAIRKQLGDTYEVDTVHKFQGREQDAIILTSVDNVITDFVDDPHMLNVAVSRAVHSLAVVTSQDPRNDQTNYGDLTRYIEYNNFEVIQSQVYDDNGYPKTKNVLAKTKKECIEKLQKLKEKRGGLKPEKVRPEMPFGDWLTCWYENHSKPKIRPITQETYESRIRLHIIPEIGDIPLNKLTQNDLQQFYGRLKKSGRKRFTDKYGEGLSDRMVRMCHATCRSALEKAVQDGLIRVNPAIGCKLPPKKAREMQVLTREDLQRFLIQAKF